MSIDSSIMLAMNHFMEELDRGTNEYWKRARFTIGKPVFSLSTRGSKYFKITSDNSVYCFIDKETGDIYKPASWRGPAKGVRANLNNYDSWMNKTDPHGSWLYK
jgi:hypothetical protein